jgi:hypothetical protein
LVLVGDDGTFAGSGGNGTLALTGESITARVGGLWIGPTSTYEVNSGSDISTLQTTYPAVSYGGVWLYGDLALDLSTRTTGGDLTLIENIDSTAVVAGTFAGLPEGETFLDDSGTWWSTITYVGGIDGNDILLTDLVSEAALLDADFDLDGDVDGADFLIWQRGWGILSGATRLDGDASGNGIVNSHDLAIWQSMYGMTSLVATSSQTAVPEPSSLTAFFSALVAFACQRVRGKSDDSNSANVNKRTDK